MQFVLDRCREGYDRVAFLIDALNEGACVGINIHAGLVWAEFPSDTLHQFHLRADIESSIGDLSR